MIRGAGIGKRHESCTFKSFIVGPNRAAVSACRRVAAGTSGGVILFGPVGRGKTYLLAALAKEFDARVSVRPIDEPDPSEPMPSVRELIEQCDEGDDAAPRLESREVEHEARVEFWPVLDLVSELRAEMKTGELTLSQRCRTCDLLVLDDLGQERVTDFVLEEIERIIDWRYRNVLPIAVSTNLSIEQMTSPERYGERAISRWAESCEMVKLGGPDRRKISAMEDPT